MQHGRGFHVLKPVNTSPHRAREKTNGDYTHIHISCVKHPVAIVSSNRKHITQTISAGVLINK